MDRFNIGYPTEEGCDICGATPAQVEPRFNYTTCEQHQNVAPSYRVEAKKQFDEMLKSSEICGNALRKYKDKHK